MRQMDITNMFRLLKGLLFGVILSGVVAVFAMPSPAATDPKAAADALRVGGNKFAAKPKPSVAKKEGGPTLGQHSAEHKSLKNMAKGVTLPPEKSFVRAEARPTGVGTVQTSRTAAKNRERAAVNEQRTVTENRAKQAAPFVKTAQRLDSIKKAAPKAKVSALASAKAKVQKAVAKVMVRGVGSKRK